MPVLLFLKVPFCSIAQASVFSVLSHPSPSVLHLFFLTIPQVHVLFQTEQFTYYVCALDPKDQILSFSFSIFKKVIKVYF